MMLKEKVAIITGSGQGLGKEFAKRFSKEGVSMKFSSSLTSFSIYLLVTETKPLVM